MSGLFIPSEILQELKLSPEQLKVELAVIFYAQKRLTMGQAKDLAELDQLAFQKALTERKIDIHYDWEDVEEDLKLLDRS
ncbi:MAG: UPF0175 family protein [Bacteroidota bacterium]